MTHICLTTQPLKEALAETFKKNLSTISEWSGREIEWMKDLPNRMKSQPRTALIVFASVNVISFCIIHYFLANALDERLPQNPDAKNRKFNRILIDGVVVGGLTLIINILLSRATKYPLNKTILAALTATAIVLHLILRHDQKIDEEVKDCEESEESELVEDSNVEDSNVDQEQESVVNSQ